MKNVVKFAAVKLLIIIIVDIVASICGFIAKYLIGSLPIESSDPALAALIIGIISSVVASAVFFGYTLRNVTKMKNIDESPAIFSAKESAVYALFLVPLAVCGICGYEFELLSGVPGIIYAPHCVFVLLGLHPLLDAVIYVAAYAFMNFLAAQLWKRKHSEPEAEPVSENADPCDEK